MDDAQNDNSLLGTLSVLVMLAFTVMSYFLGKPGRSMAWILCIVYLVFYAVILGFFRPKAVLVQIIKVVAYVPGILALLNILVFSLWRMTPYKPHWSASLVVLAVMIRFCDWLIEPPEVAPKQANPGLRYDQSVVGDRFQLLDHATSDRYTSTDLPGSSGYSRRRNKEKPSKRPKKGEGG